MQDIWGQSKNTVNLASSVGLFLSIFTLTPNIANGCGLAKQIFFRHNLFF